MTDTSNMIDPTRPWIDDPRDAPSSLRLLPTLTNPFGTTSRLHFTRAWTYLFFARVFSVLIPGVLMFVFGAAGANTDALGALFMLVPVTFVLTLLMSTVIHIRRLGDAERPAMLAGIVWLPFILAAAVFFLLVSTSTPELTGGGGGGGWGRPQTPQQIYQGWVSGNANMAIFTYIAVLIPVTVWSLVWVGRLPNGGGRIEDRFDDEHQPYQ